jgi:hypothetical protein
MEDQFFSEKEVPFFKTSWRFGLLGAMILISLVLVQHVFDLNVETWHTVVFGTLAFIVYIIIARMSILAHREDDLDGYISMGRGLTTGLIACIIAGLIGGAFNVLYMHFIDPSILENLLNKTRDQYEAQGLDDEQIEAAIKVVKMMMGPIVGIAVALLNAAILGLIASLPVAYILKKDRPV